MASELKVDKFTGVSTAGSIDVTGEGNSTTTNLQQGLSKSWLNLDGSLSTPAFRDSFNLGSITDNGTGTFNPNFTNSMGNANYGYGATVANADDGGAYAALGIVTLATGTFRIDCESYADGSQVDAPRIGVIINGDLA